MKRVIVFGAFDSLHEGHKNMLAQARALGDFLLVIMARDENIRRFKNREPRQPEATRVQTMREAGLANEVMLGVSGDRYRLLGDLDFDVIALGYDQLPDDVTVREELDRRGKSQVQIVRLKPYRPDVYKSSLISKKV